MNESRFLHMGASSILLGFGSGAVKKSLHEVLPYLVISNLSTGYMNMGAAQPPIKVICVEAERIIPSENFDYSDFRLCKDGTFENSARTMRCDGFWTSRVQIFIPVGHDDIRYRTYGPNAEHGSFKYPNYGHKPINAVALGEYFSGKGKMVCKLRVSPGNPVDKACEAKRDRVCTLILPKEYYEPNEPLIHHKEAWGYKNTRHYYKPSDYYVERFNKAVSRKEDRIELPAYKGSESFRWNFDIKKYKMLEGWEHFNNGDELCEDSISASHVRKMANCLRTHKMPWEQSEREQLIEHLSIVGRHEQGHGKSRLDSNKTVSIPSYSTDSDKLFFEQCEQFGTIHKNQELTHAERQAKAFKQREMTRLLSGI